MSEKKIDIKISELFNPKFRKIVNIQKRHLVLMGGAGSGKSFAAVQKMLFRILTEKDHKILCIRKIARTLRNSVFTLWQEVLDQFGCMDIVKINKTDMEITFPDFNSSVLFAGIDDPEKIKSIQGITSVFIEEATELTEADCDQINLRMRGKTKTYFQIIYAFNPISVNHWLRKRFFLKKIKDVHTLKTTYRDNKHLDDNYKQVLQKLKDRDIYRHQVYCEGQWGELSGQIFTNWTIEDLSEYKFDLYYFGLDLGFNSPSALIKAAVKDETIYILDEFYEKQASLGRLAEVIKEMAGGELIMVDSAEPRSIDQLRQYGINCVGAKKGPDSIRNGIKWIQERKMIVHNECQNAINELQQYHWLTLKDGQETERPAEGDDHLIDALRYSLENRIKQCVIPWPTFSAAELGF